MSADFYKANPDLYEYFNSLPPAVQKQITESGAEISTLGELIQCAQHLMQSWGDMMSESFHLCLSDLLDQDLSSYEYFYSLPSDIQNKIKRSDVRSFEEMQEYVAKLRNY